MFIVKDLNEYKTVNLKFGSKYDNKGNLNVLNQITINKNTKLYIGYLINNSYKSIYLSLKEGSFNWYELPICSIFKDNYNNIKFNITFNLEYEYTKIFFKLINKINKDISTLIDNNIKDNLNQLNCFYKIDKYEKDDKKYIYLNYLKIKQNFKDPNKLRSKIYLKEKVNGSIENKLLNSIDQLIGKSYHILPTIHLSSIYIKYLNDINDINYDLFIENCYLYEKKNNLTDPNNLNDNLLKYQINEDTY